MGERAEGLKVVLLTKVTHLEAHKLVVGLRSPGVDLHRGLQSDHEKLDALVADDLEVDGSLEISDVHPAIPLFRLEGRRLKVGTL